MRRGKPGRVEQVWRERIDAANAYAGTAAGYCRTHEIDLNSFYTWRKRIKAKDTLKSDSTFAAAVIDVRPSFSSKSLASLPEARWVAEVMAHFVGALR